MATSHWTTCRRGCHGRSWLLSRPGILFLRLPRASDPFFSRASTSIAKGRLNPLPPGGSLRHEEDRRRIILFIGDARARALSAMPCDPVALRRTISSQRSCWHPQSPPNVMPKLPRPGTSASFTPDRRFRHSTPALPASGDQALAIIRSRCREATVGKAAKGGDGVVVSRYARAGVALAARSLHF